ncbi:MAG: FAD-dependent oxidoreductase [Epsilonproteobacteria bacterium]|nr:FAD-dependent oxidoreductase [Campylobacterota bacterium]NPA64270.1 FAD-dependent oxidoreductase [Campylobacterota bacterium]
MRVAIVGGGIAGSAVAMILRRIGVEFTLFEKRSSLVSGPPMCHLHAGGNLYPDIDDTQRLRLLKESLELMRLFPQAIDYRPTALAVPKNDPNDPIHLAKRAARLQKEYAKLCSQDKANQLLGDPSSYLKSYTYQDLLRLQAKEQPTRPSCPDEWMIPFAKEVDLDQLKYPVLLVREFGLNIFRIAATAQILLDGSDIRLKSEVLHIQKKNTFHITLRQNGKIVEEEFDYLINAAGFESGKIDDDLGYARERFVEFKAAYVTRWQSQYRWPEVIFHGPRGSEQGMGQFTPYAGGYFQLHGMTPSITLFEDGLAKSAQSAQPRLASSFVQMIEDGWPKDLIYKRTTKAIQHLARFIPSFQSAQGGAKPLYGAQQIPGSDATLRAAEVSFEKDYARCEIVKASSIVAMAQSIVQEIGYSGSLPIDTPKLDKEILDQKAQDIARQRGYPAQMGLLANATLDECS